jgi:hypothetical protein
VRTEDVFWLNQLSSARKPVPVAERSEAAAETSGEDDRTATDLLSLPQPA